MFWGPCTNLWKTIRVPCQQSESGGGKWVDSTEKQAGVCIEAPACTGYLWQERWEGRGWQAGKELEDRELELPRTVMCKTLTSHFSGEFICQFLNHVVQGFILIDVEMGPVVLQCGMNWWECDCSSCVVHWDLLNDCGPTPLPTVFIREMQNRRTVVAAFALGVQWWLWLPCSLKCAIQLASDGTGRVLHEPTVCAPSELLAVPKWMWVAACIVSQQCSSQDLAPGAVACPTTRGRGNPGA